VKASSQPATMVANRSTMKEDLYLVYSGVNQDTGRPIIKAHLNPLVKWIWIGAHILLLGTILAMIPSMATAKVPVRSAAAVLADSRQTVGVGD
jgi:cytochrome c-type biogenesis protein CcmF